VRGKDKPFLRDPPLPRGLISHTDQATGLVSQTFACYTTVAGQCRNLTGLRCFLYVPTIADGVNLTHEVLAFNNLLRARHQISNSSNAFFKIGITKSK
jgi:hypothetical protein